jgi:hypothetical protein
LQQRVGRDDDVVLGHAGGHFMAVFAVQHQAAQPRAKAFGFAPPVAHQADRGNDERGLRQAACVFFDLDVGQRLQGFAQAHVVGQDAGQTVFAQKLQPVQALLLVGAQAGLHAGGHRHFGHFGAATQTLHHLAQVVRAFPHRAFALARRWCAWRPGARASGCRR